MSLTFPRTARGRTNIDLRKSLGGAETPTSPNGNSTFRSRSGSGTYGYKSRQNDTGYASSISSGLFVYHSNQVSILATVVIRCHDDERRIILAEYEKFICLFTIATQCQS